MPIKLRLAVHAMTATLRAAGFSDDEPIEAQAAVGLRSLPHRPRPADRCMAAPELRTRQTAIGLGFEPVIDPLLRDCDYGRWRGRTFTDIQRTEARALADWMTDPAAAPHGGESLEDVSARCAAWLSQQADGSGQWLVVTHASVIRLTMMRVLGAPLSAYWHVDAPPLAGVSLSFNRTWRLQLSGGLILRAGRPGPDGLDQLRPTENEP
ncbi:histidine phosphatase family protein [Lichenicola cladoniae]|uniref:Histidine phosphatase family protein n=1 Tax=Lichenicola cladoniae TaxID=1484109 RepID=A0A6M8HRK3_9PROT|nr:histidine phosphatase family protein [Lichenicola cladoniae]NPD68726.1 histidine phosphatase family protein [Acetobacteraceae bacterium]QKE90841.1 histidine phosphatase family protein [Lichenicola cladoniae]